MGERDGEVALKGWLENRGNESEGDLPEKLDLGGNKENFSLGRRSAFFPAQKKNPRSWKLCIFTEFFFCFEICIFTEFAGSGRITLAFVNGSVIFLGDVHYCKGAASALQIPVLFSNGTWCLLANNN